jgi:hypothetical protein
LREHFHFEGIPVRLYFRKKWCVAVFGLKFIFFSPLIFMFNRSFFHFWTKFCYFCR